MKKIYLTLILILALAFALVIVSNATDLLYTSDQTALEDMTLEGTSHDGVVDLNGYGYGFFVNYGNVPEGNFILNIVEIGSSGYYGYLYWLSSYEAFQVRYNGYTVEQIYNEWVEQGLYNLTYLTYECVEYFLNYQPSVSQSVYNELQQGFNTLQGEYNQLQTNFGNIEQNYQNLSNSYNTLEGNYNSLQNEYNVRVSMYNELQIEYNDLATRSENAYNTLQGEYNTLESNYNTLQGEYNTLESTIPVVRQEGYNQGLEDADALTNGLGVILSAPVYFLNNVFNFEILGFSMRSIFATIITVLTIAWVTKKLSY